jgi:hypothetical protein
LSRFRVESAKQLRSHGHSETLINDRPCRYNWPSEAEAPAAQWMHTEGGGIDKLVRLSNKKQGSQGLKRLRENYPLKLSPVGTAEFFSAGRVAVDITGTIRTSESIIVRPKQEL